MSYLSVAPWHSTNDGDLTDSDSCPSGLRNLEIPGRSKTIIVAAFSCCSASNDLG